MSYFTTIQEQEHLDFVAGEASEFQNCHSEAVAKCHRLASQHAIPISRAKALGLFVVVREVAYYCRATDAFAGTYDTFVCAFPSQASADQKVRKLCNPERQSYGDDDCAYRVVHPN
jgi:hypothetical protein